MGNGSKHIELVRMKITFITIACIMGLGSCERDPYSPFLNSTLSSNRDDMECYDSHYENCTIRNYNEKHHRGNGGIPFKGCSCSSDCHFYGSCCWDYPKNSNANAIVRLSPSHMCISSDNQTFSLITKCPANWSDQWVREKCETDFSSFPDPFLKLLTTSTRTYKTYANVYCATCNGETELTPWKVTFKCPILKTRTRRLPKVCSLLMSSTLTELNKTTCMTEMIENSFSKGEAFTKGTNALLCSTYYTPVRRVYDGRIYRNKFCAFCDGASYNELECKDYFSGVRIDSSPYSVLLDFDLIAGGKYGKHKERRCSPGEVFDPWISKCRAIIFFNQFTTGSDKSKLHKNEETSLNISKEIGETTYTTAKETDVIVKDGLSSEFKRCEKIISNHSFSLDENRNLKFTGTEKMLKPGQYEILANDIIIYCDVTNSASQPQDILTLVCLSLSVSCLFLKVILHVVLPNQSKFSQRSIVSLSSSVLLAQLLFLIGSSRTEWGLGCKLVAIGMHYFFLASLFWSNALAYNIWKTFFGTYNSNRRKDSKKKFFLYSLYSWLMPMILVSISVALEISKDSIEEGWRPSYGEHLACWISNGRALLVFFVVPLTALLLANFTFFFSTAYQICRTNQDTKFLRRNSNSSAKIKLLIYFKLALIMGLTWIFGCVASISKSDFVWITFTLLNGLQGFFLLAAFTRFRDVCMMIQGCGMFGIGGNRNFKWTRFSIWISSVKENPRNKEDSHIDVSNKVTEATESH